MLGFHHKLIQHTQLHFPQAKVTNMSSLHLSATLSTYQYILVCTGDVQQCKYILMQPTPTLHSNQARSPMLPSRVSFTHLSYALRAATCLSAVSSICQATQARLATSKLPQPLINQVDVAATPAILRSSVCTTLRETRIFVLAVLRHLLHACLHHTMLYKILSNLNRAQCSTTRYILIQTWYILVLNCYMQVHTGMYLLHTRPGHIAQGICIPCTYTYRLCMHQYTLYLLGGERFHVKSHTLGHSRRYVQIQTKSQYILMWSEYVLVRTHCHYATRLRRCSDIAVLIPLVTVLAPQSNGQSQSSLIQFTNLVHVQSEPCSGLVQTCLVPDSSRYILCYSMIPL